VTITLAELKNVASIDGASFNNMKIVSGVLRFQD
jgi:hypothetical protein